MEFHIFSHLFSVLQTLSIMSILLSLTQALLNIPCGMARRDRGKDGSEFIGLWEHLLEYYNCKFE